MLGFRMGARALLLASVLVLAFSACGGDDSGSVVSSTDGIATLSVDVASLPEGVTLGDISVEAASIESDDSETPMLAVRLLPDGLMLESPAVLTVELPRSPEGGLVVVHTSTDSIEFLAGEFAEADGVSTFTTEVEHFSIVTYIDYEAAGFKPTVILAPGDVVEGQSQTAVGKVNVPLLPFQFWGHFPTDGANTWRLVGFSAPQLPIEFDAPRYSWGGGAGLVGSWDPPVRRVGATRTAAGYDFSPGLSQCVSANTTQVHLLTTASFNVEFLGVGGPVDRNLRIFAELPDKNDGEVGAGTPLVTAVGKTVPLVVNIDGSVPTSCAGVSGTSAGSTTTTSGFDSTTRPPSGENVSIPETQVVGVDYEFGSHTFTVTVEGDGQSLAESSETVQYIVHFSAETPEGSFLVSPSFENGELVVTVYGDDFQVFQGGDVAVEWISPNTLVVFADEIGNDSAATSVSVNVQAMVIQADGSTAYYSSFLAWTP